MSGADERDKKVMSESHKVVGLARGCYLSKYNFWIFFACHLVVGTSSFVSHMCLLLV